MCFFLRVIWEVGKKTHPDTFASCWYNYRLCIFCANPGYHVFKRNVTWGRNNGFFFVHIFMFTITYIQSTILKAVPEWSVFEAFASLSWCASCISIVDIAWYCSILQDLTHALPFPEATHTNVVRGFKSPLSCDRISVRLWTMASSRWTSTQTHSGLIGAASVNLSRSTTTTCRSFAERWLGGYYRIRDTCGMTCLLWPFLPLTGS